MDNQNYNENQNENKDIKYIFRKLSKSTNSPTKV